MTTYFEMLQQQRFELIDQADAITDRADAEKRELTADEQAKYDELKANILQINDLSRRELKRNEDQATLERTMAGLGIGGASARDVGGAGFVDLRTGKPAEVRAGESFGTHPVVAAARQAEEAQEQAATAAHGSLAGQLRALATTGGGGAIVPTAWSSTLIDRARNASVALRAGAQLIPMDAGTVKIGRVLGDPTATFRAEGSAIPLSDPTIDSVTLEAKTLSSLVVVSMEWLQDSVNGEKLVVDAIGAAMASKVDEVALYGGTTSGAGSVNLPTPPNPRGILASLQANLPAHVLGGAANGTTQTAGSYYNEALDTIYLIRSKNEEPNALVWNSKLARQYAGANDTTGQPLRMPADVEAIPRYVANSLPSYTQGTMTDRANDLFAGDFTKLLIGQRLGLTIQVLTERYADTGQIGIVCHWRGDVGLARPAAFAVYRGLQGAV